MATPVRENTVMTIDRRMLLIGSLGVAGCRSATSLTTGSPLQSPEKSREVIRLWPGDAPGKPVQPLVETIVCRSDDPRTPDRAVHGVAAPRLFVFRPKYPNGTAAVIAPGGAYRRVVIDHEGFATARWLAARGITAFVLVYRLPGEGWAAGADVSLSDAQRAIRLVRHHADAFAIDRERVVIIGFSAGGHLAASLATRHDAATYAPVDEADAMSARPSSAALIYPVISMTAPLAHAVSREKLLGADPDEQQERRHSPHLNVSNDTPPCFLVHAEDDRSVVVDNTLVMRAALVARHIPVETHLFSTGGHGFGLAADGNTPAAVWPQMWLQFAKSNGLL